ncbi:MAG: hypothetical protein WAO76_10705 [Georgfuchsia sp.]
MKERRFRLYAPLLDFVWEGDTLAFAPELEITRIKRPAELAGMDDWLSAPEWDRASNAAHWLVHEHTAGAVPHAGEVENLVLLSLWLVKPTKTQIAHRFKLGLAEGEGENGMSRLLDRFMWIPGSIDVEFSTSELQSAANLYATLMQACRTRGRLNNALLLTIGGCWAHDWQVSLICHAAAAEALLTYSTGPGITRRLASSFACLMETDSSKRDAAFLEFKALYSIRSDIMHGRTHNVGASDRLPTLVCFQAVLRKLWNVVLSSPALLAVLEDTDAQREVYFTQLQQGYNPP